MEIEEMPYCAAREQSDRQSTKLQHIKFSFFKLRKEQFFLQEHTALLSSFLPGVTKSAPGPQHNSLSCKGKASRWWDALMAGELSGSLL